MTDGGKERWLTPGVKGIGGAILLGGPLLALALVAAFGIRGAILVSGVFGLLAARSIV